MTSASDESTVSDKADTNLPVKVQGTEKDSIAIAELRYTWEILETARVGYQKLVDREGTRDQKLHLAEVSDKARFVSNCSRTWTLLSFIYNL